MKGDLAAKQLSLFESETPCHEIAVEPVPDRVALRPDSVKIVIYATYTNGREERFPLPIQWTKQEAGALLPDIRGVSWQLGDNGRPIAEEAVAEICEAFLEMRDTYLPESPYDPDYPTHLDL